MEYKRQHNWFETKIPWEICRKFGIEKKEKWYIVKLEVVMEYDKCKIYVASKNEWIMKRPDLTVVQKSNYICQIIDFACSYDGRVDTKELEKIEHY